MANNKSLKLLRNTSIFSTKENAVEYLYRNTPTSDGTPILARYDDTKSGKIKTLLGLQAIGATISGSTGESYTTIIDSDGIDDFVVDPTSEKVSTGESATNVAVLTIDDRKIKVANIQKAIDSKSIKSLTLTSQDIVTDATLVRDEDGSGVSINIEHGGNTIKLTGYEPITDNVDAEIRSSDTVNLAIAKLEKKADDLALSGITSVEKLEGDETIPTYENAGNGIQIEREGSVVKVGIDVTKMEGTFDFGNYIENI